MTINTIKKYFELRGLKFPEHPKQAIDFAVTEMGEVMDAFIRLTSDEWIRNNPDKKPNLWFELADCYMMLEIASSFSEMPLDQHLFQKMLSKLDDDKQGSLLDFIHNEVNNLMATANAKMTKEAETESEDNIISFNK